MENIPVTNATSEGNVQYPKKVNVAAERAALAGLCQFGHEVFVDVNEIVDIDCFTSHMNQMFYKCLTELLNKSTSVDAPTLISTWTALGLGDQINEKQHQDYMRSLFSFNISQENCIKNCKLIKKLDIVRKAQKVMKDSYVALSEINGTESIDEIVSQIEKPVFDYTMGLGSGEDDKTERMGDGIDEFVDFLATERPEISGIPSPWAIYNESIGGGRRRGGVYLTAARPKTGKSSWAINDAIHVASLGIPVLYLDTEMNKKSQLPRIIASLTSQGMKQIEAGMFADNEFHYNQVRKAAQTLKTIPLYYRKISGKPFEEIVSIIRRWLVKDVGTENGVRKDCLVIYDYFKLMDTGDLDKMQEYQALGFQIQMLSDMCGTYDFPCSAYVQMNRDGITKDTTDVLSQSDRLLWLCSSLALLKRKTTEEIMTAGPENGNMKLIVTGDQRFGPGLDDGDWINFAFDKDKCQIKELTTKRNGRRSDNGFDTSSEVGTMEDGFSDDDFDSADYRDDQYRTD